MKTLAASVIVGPLAAVVSMVALFAPPSTGTGGGPSVAALGEIPADLLPVYQAAAATCPGLPWQVLAGIGFIESHHAGGRADPATGDVDPPIIGPPIDGRPGFAAIRDPSSPDGWAHALGPMQFLSTTWRRWATLAPGRPPGAAPSVHNAWDAIHAAVANLCADAGPTGDLAAALYAYNRSETYVDAVLAKATEYGWGQPASLVDGALVAGPGEAVVAAAAMVLGTPYVWGGESPETGFDCSGLVQWAYAQIGMQLPRTTRQLINVGLPVALEDLRPGDLIFSPGGLVIRDLGHVVLYAGGGTVIAAPHRGTVVQYQILDVDRIQAARRVIG